MLIGIIIAAVVLVAAVAVVLVLVLSKDKEDDQAAPTKSPKPSASESAEPTADPDPTPPKTSAPPDPDPGHDLPVPKVDDAWCDSYFDAEWGGYEEWELVLEIAAPEMKSSVADLIEYLKALDDWFDDPDASWEDIPEFDTVLENQLYDWLEEVVEQCY
jgi:hypothetical protein